MADYDYIERWLIDTGCDCDDEGDDDCHQHRVEAVYQRIVDERDRYRDALRGLVWAYGVVRGIPGGTYCTRVDVIGSQDAWTAALDALARGGSDG
jgi:hypothetical protein